MMVQLLQVNLLDPAVVQQYGVTPIVHIQTFPSQPVMQTHTLITASVRVDGSSWVLQLPPYMVSESVCIQADVEQNLVGVRIAGAR